MKKAYSEPEIAPLGLFTEETQKGFLNWWDDQSGNNDNDSDPMANASP